jgi:chromosome segregation ATPase
MKTDTDLMRKVSMAADGVMRLEERLANDVLRRDSLTAAEAETDAAIERATKDLDIKRERLASLERDGADVVKCLLNLEEDHRLRALELREKDVRDRCEASRGRILFLEGRLKEANLDVYDTTRHLAALNGFTLSANTHIVSTCCS